MKRNIILTATTASVLTLSVMAQQNVPSKTDRSVYAPDRVTRSGTEADRPHNDRQLTDRMPGGQQQGERMYSAAKASEIIGMTVNNYQDEKLGSINDLAVDLESGRIVQVIVSTGGFAGMGDRLSAVPPGALHHDAMKNVLHLDANKEKLKNAPEFKSAKWAESSDTEHVSAVYALYGQESALKFINKDQGDTTNDRANTTNDRAVTPSNRGTTEANWNKNRMSGENQWMIPASRLGQTQKASKLMGLTVKNQQGEELGKVDNMLVDVQSGRVVAVVISTGGFLGMRDELSAVPPTALSFNAERDALQLDASKDRLAAAPHFKSDQWPDFNEATYSDSVYRAYQATPYFTANAVTDADNSARNVRDRNDRSLTPLDQGNSKADTDTTAQIRKGILGGKGMSVNAKNVKVITDKGRVTLRGPVKNEEEKRLIGEIANRIARVENVDNQLEVALPPTSN